MPSSPTTAIWAALAALIVFIIALWILQTVGVPYAAIISLLLAALTFFGYSRVR